MNAAKNHRTLSQLNQFIKKLIEENLGGKRFWLKSEISQIKENRSGHMYLDLIEQKEGRIIAKSKANIWSSDLVSIRRELGNEFSNVMKQGSEIMCLVEARYSEIYGFSIQIYSVDLSFNLGELERKKQETIRKLQKEGLMEINKLIDLPMVIQKIAVISAEGSDGLKDLTDQLEKNQYGYVFEYKLYPAAVQGERAAVQITEQIKNAQEINYDALIIVRGGGSKIDLDAFNDHRLCVAIAQCKLPVLTGIGHENDLSVADMVANQRLKTPSAVGSFLIEKAHNADVNIHKMYERIRHLFKIRMDMGTGKIQLGLNRLRSTAISASQLRRGVLHNSAGRVVRFALESLTRHSRELSFGREKLGRLPFDGLKDKKGTLKMRSDLLLHKAHTMVRESNRQSEVWKAKLGTNSNLILRHYREELEFRSQHINNLHPNRILKRGFSITRKSDTAINHRTPLKEGDLLEIEIYKKKIFVQFLNDEPKWNELKKELDTKTPQKS